MSEEIPPNNRQPTNKLDLVLWRLERIERTLDHNVLTREEYEIKHTHLAGRVEELERDAEQSEADKKKLAAGVLVALTIPFGRWILDLLKLTTG